VRIWSSNWMEGMVYVGLRSVSYAYAPNTVSVLVLGYNRNLCCSTWLGNHNVDQIIQRVVRRVRLRGGVCLLHVSWK